MDVIVETGAGEAAGFTDEAYREAGATIGDPWTADVVAKVAAPTADEAARLHDGQVLIAFLVAVDRHRRRRAARRGGCPRLRARVGAAHHARAADGRAVVAGDRGRLQGGADRGRPDAPLLPDADDRRRDDPAREGARAGRGCRRAAGDRDDEAPRRCRLGVRRAPRRARAGRVARRDVPRPRHPGRGDRGRLRR